MTDETRNLVMRRSALGLMGIGAVGVASETLGFTQLSADRGVNVAVANDLNAVLGLEGNSSDDTVDGDPLSNLEEENIEDDLTITFTNQSDVTLESTSDLIVTIDETGGDSELTVTETLSFDSDEDITAGGEETYNIDEDLNTNDDASIVLENNDTEDATIDVTVDAEFNGTTLNLTREDITITDTS